MTRKQAIEHGKEQLQIFGGEHKEFIEVAVKCLEEAEAHSKEPAERDCEHCIHHKDKGCSRWDCHFERRTDADSN